MQILPEGHGARGERAEGRVDVGIWDRGKLSGERERERERERARERRDAGGGAHGESDSPDRDRKVKADE